jgi:subfamily B ATP-binding cassette protein MsbA
MHNLFEKVSDKEWKNDVHSLWVLTREYLPRLAAAIAASLLVSSINGAIAWLVKPALDNLFVEKHRTLLLFLPVGVFLLFVMRGMFDFINNFLMSSIGAKVVKSLRQDIYSKLLRLPMVFYARKSSGSIISRILNDIGVLEGQIAYVAKNFFVQSSTIIILAFVALYRRWDLALLSFAVIPLIVLVSDRLGKRMKKTSVATRNLISRVTEIVHETLAGIRVIKSFTMEEEMLRRNEHATANHYRNAMREVRINEFTSFLLEVIAGVGIAVILWYGSYLILNGRLPVGDFFSFVAAVLMIYTPMKRLSQANNYFQVIRASLGRIKEIFLLESEIQGKEKDIVVQGHIIYKDVSFRYAESGEDVLADINIEISPGETLAVVGYSGAGKSTFSDLLMGFWHNYSGTISVDGMEIRDYSLKWLRSHIGMVSQDIMLFDDTVGNNIRWGRPGASDEEIEKAAKAAYAHDFIMTMPKRYDTGIGERGVKLSGGQKQRIALARAILKNPKILILDEATSSLDSESEANIQKALEDFLPGRTTIIIAHRLSTLKNASRVIVMDKGGIVQQGAGEELVKVDGIYRNLYTKAMSSDNSV